MGLFTLHAAEKRSFAVPKESMDAIKFLKMFLLFASVVLMLQPREVDSKKSKIVFLPMPMISSQYFVALQVAEEMASRGHMVRLQIQGCHLLSSKINRKKLFVRFYVLKGDNRSAKNRPKSSYRKKYKLSKSSSFMLLLK